MADPAGQHQPPSLDEFSRRLDAARGAAASEENAPDEGRGKAIGIGFRAASELLASLLVGTGLGFLLDRFAPTSPWGLLAGIFVGFAAGVITIARAMKPDKAGDDAGGG